MKSSSPPEKVLLVLPEAFKCSGGIQMFNRALCMAAGNWAKSQGASASVLVLNDDATPDVRYVNGGFASFVGARHSKVRFVRHFLRQIFTTKYTWIIFGHVSLSPLALIVSAFRPAARLGVIAHGVEVWHPLSRLQRKALQRSDFILAVSEYTKSELIKHNGLGEGKISIFPNTLDPHWEKTPINTNFDSKYPVLLSVSRMNKEDRYKGIDDVIRSLATVVRECGPVSYNVVGHGDDVPRLQALAAGLGVSRYVNFMGELPDSELREQYQQCSLFAMPSRKEGFGIVFLEAMAYGKPVVGGAHGGTPSVVKDGETGLLVENSDVPGIAQAIIHLLNDVETRVQFGKAGHERLLNRFTFDQFERNFRGVVETLQVRN